MKRKKTYIEVEIDNEFEKFAMKLQDSEIAKALEFGKLKQAYCTKTIKSGKQFEVEIFPVFTKKQAKLLGLKKKKNQAQKNLNDRNSRKRLERLINANFDENSYWVTLTYSSNYLPKSVDEAMKNMKNYISRINYRRKKLNLKNAKYIYIIEFSQNKKRIHHHMIIDDGLSMDEIETLWKYGRRNNVRRVAPDDEGLSGLAKYLTKNPEGSKRWKSSKNLKQPIEHKSFAAFDENKIIKMANAQERIGEILQKKYKSKRFV